MIVSDVIVPSSTATTDQARNAIQADTCSSDTHDRVHLERHEAACPKEVRILG